MSKAEVRKNAVGLADTLFQTQELEQEEARALCRTVVGDYFNEPYSAVNKMLSVLMRMGCPMDMSQGYAVFFDSVGDDLFAKAMSVAQQAGGIRTFEERFFSSPQSNPQYLNDGKEQSVIRAWMKDNEPRIAQWNEWVKEINTQANPVVFRRALNAFYADMGRKSDALPFSQASTQEKPVRGNVPVTAGDFQPQL